MCYVESQVTGRHLATGLSATPSVCHNTDGDDGLPCLQYRLVYGMEMVAGRGK